MNVQILKHEYGHILQERELGELKYIKYIAVPSASSNLFNNLDYELYYSQPWECSASILGNSNIYSDPMDKVAASEYYEMARRG